jgi:TatD DNase family protein
MIIDSHAHLYYPELKENIENILENAAVSGVEKIIVPAVDLKSAGEIMNLCSKYKEIYAAVGFHPGDIKNTDLSELKYLDDYLNEEKVVAVGEIGLDYYWDKSQIEKQKVFFKEQLEIAVSRNLPVIIHTRDSVDDAVAVIKKMNSDSLKGQFHCFDGDENNLNDILGMQNFFVSYCGNVTFKNFRELNLLKNTPVNRLLFETDSPFLTPVPFRGKPNQPAYVIHTIEKISQILNMDLHNLKQIVYNNTLTLFNL